MLTHPRNSAQFLVPALVEHIAGLMVNRGILFLGASLEKTQKPFLRGPDGGTVYLSSSKDKKVNQDK